MSLVMLELEKYVVRILENVDLNTRAIDEGLRRRKPDLKAYEKVDDSRFQVGIHQF